MVGVVCPVAFIGVALVRDDHRLSTRDTPSDEDWLVHSGTDNFSGSTFAVIPHAHSQGHDRWKLGSGNWERRAPVAGCA